MSATKVITNFGGRLTRYTEGDVDSGMAKYDITYGNDPFTSPGNLTWYEAPTQIDAAGSVITDLIMAARPRLESGITYVYAIGHTGRLYKIQVNDPTTYNPNYDHPVLLATLSASSPTFKYGSSIQFYGATERIYIGHDLGVTRIDFAGTNETLVGTLGSYTANVPRPSVNFNGVTYWGNGANLLAIDSTATVTTYAKLSPAFPVGTVVRDIDVSPDGNYAQIVVSRVPAQDMTVASQDTTSLTSADSYLIYWNGTDTGYTSYNPYNSYSLNTNISYGPNSYTMGYDLGGAAIYSGGNKVITLRNSLSPNFNALFSTGNLLGFATPETNAGFLKATLMMYGNYDEEIPKGLYRLFRASATGTETDVIQMPTCSIVSNLFYGSSSAGYSGNQVGSAKIYYSTLETSNGPTTKYKLYKFTTVPTGLGTTIGGVYETQTEYFLALFRNIVKKKFTIPEVRLYTKPLITGNSFKVELIGVDGGVIQNSSQTFTVGTNVTAGTNGLKYSPQIAPTSAIAFRITNLGSVNWVGTKLEYDFVEAGD